MRTVRYAVGDSSPGSLTMDGFASYTSYTFTVSAIEDGGPTVAGDAPASATSLDTLAPQFNGGIVTAARGIARHDHRDLELGDGCRHGCRGLLRLRRRRLVHRRARRPRPDPDRRRRKRYDPQRWAEPLGSRVRRRRGGQSVRSDLDLAPHAASRNPVITLSGGNGNGCAPLVASVKSSDSGTPPPTFHLFVDGGPQETPIDQVIGGAPYAQVTLVAVATFGRTVAGVGSGGGPCLRPGRPRARCGSPAAHKADPSTEQRDAELAPGLGGRCADHRLHGHEQHDPGYGERDLRGAVGRPPDHGSRRWSRARSTSSRSLPSTPATGESDPAQTRFRIDDNVPPTAPVLNAPVAGGRDVLLSWAPSSDNVAVDDYKIFMDGVLTAARHLHPGRHHRPPRWFHRASSRSSPPTPRATRAPRRRRALPRRRT